MNRRYIDNAVKVLKELRYIKESFRVRDDSSVIEFGKAGVDKCLLLPDLTHEEYLRLSYSPIGRGIWEARTSSRIYAVMLRSALDDISLRWKHAPFLFDPNESAKNLKLEEKYLNDVEVFKEISNTVSVDFSTCKKFFESTKTPYVNIAPKGLFVTLPVSRNRFRNVPDFYRNFAIKYRAMMVGNKDGYEFRIYFSVFARTKSKFNIAPARGGRIDVPNIRLPR